MASVFKRRDPTTGKLSKKYTVQYTDPATGKKRRKVAYTDKTKSWQLAHKLENGEPSFGPKSILENPSDFKASLEASKKSKQHCNKTFARVRAIIDGCGFRLVTEINTTDIETWLHQQENKGVFGAKTRNHYAKAFKQFCRWMVKRKRIPHDPVGDLELVNTQTDTRYKRRVMKLMESKRLISVAERGETYRVKPGSKEGLSGSERAVLYELVLTTGLRANECSGLTARSFRFGKSPTMTVEAEFDKSGGTNVLPLRNEVADRIKGLVNCDPGKPLFPGRWYERAAEMLRKDLKVAGIPYKKQGEVLDFHALRHTFITNLASSGVHPKDAQILARHSDINLTMNYYTHSDASRQRDAVNKLPSLR